MEKLETALRYIELYTACNKHTLKRIRVLLEDMKCFGPPEIVTKVIETTKIVLVNSDRENQTFINFEEWCANYLLENNVKYEDLIKENRKKVYVDGRSKFCVMAREQGYTYTEIGGYLKKDHSTIIHSVNRIQNNLKKHKTNEEAIKPIARNTIPIIRKRSN